MALIPVAILVRVSKDIQNTNRQIDELTSVAGKKGWSIVEVIEEHGLSGALEESKRHGLARVQELTEAGLIKKLLVHEVSRIARKNSTSHKLLEDLEAAGVSLYWHAQNIETLLPSGKRNPAASLMFSMLAELARNERETLRERIKSGLEQAKRDGKQLGRPEGSKIPKGDFLAKHKDIVKQLKAGQSVRDTAKITGKGASTVQRVKKLTA